MSDPAYISVSEDGHLTLYWGDGTEAEKVVIWRGPRAVLGPELVDLIEELRIWAEDNGYEVVVPPYDFTQQDNLPIEVPDAEVEQLDLNDVDNLLDNLYVAGEYDEGGYDIPYQPDEPNDDEQPR